MSERYVNRSIEYFTNNSPLSENQYLEDLYFFEKYYALKIVDFTDRDRSITLELYTLILLLGMDFEL